ncbi:MAG: hypothetical protein WD556_11395 [Actinomycetota bacterium]
MPGPYAPSDARNYVGIGKQTVRATSVAPTAFVPYIDAVDMDHGQAINRIMEAGANGQVTHSEKTGHIPGGGFTFLGRPSITPKLAAFLMGVDSIGAAVSGVTPHTITDDLVTDYLSIEQNAADESVERFKDSVIGELTFNCDRDNPKLRVKGTWLGGILEHKGSTATADSYETEEPWVLSECAFTVDGSGDTEVTGFELTIRVKASQEKISGVHPVHIVKLGFECELSFTRLDLAITNTGYRRVNYGTTGGTTASVNAVTGAFVANFTRGTAATARRFQLNAANIDYDSAVYTPLDPNASEGMKVVYAAQARKAAGASLLEVLGNNTDAAAYVT